MQTQLLFEFGDDSKFTPTELPVPETGPGQVLVQMVATSINPIECKLRRHGGPIAPELPALLGSDLAGRIVATGPGVEDFGPGDEVFGYIGGVHGHPGAYAEMAVVDACLIALAPRSIPLAHAAALPLAGLTADEALERAQVGPAHSILILGATGGVGHLAVQIAHALGAQVHAGVRSPDKVKAALGLGAQSAFVTDEEPLTDYTRRVTNGMGFDALVDCTAGVDLGSLFEALRDGGHLVSLVTRRACDLGLMSRKGLSLHSIFVPNALISGVGRDAYTRRLKRIADLVEAGLIAPQIDRRSFTLDQIAQAHSAFERGGCDGRILVLCNS